MRKLTKVSKAKEIYSALLDDEIKNKIDAAYLNLLYGNQGLILDGLVGDDSEAKDQKILMGEYTYNSYKQMFTEKWEMDYNYEFFAQFRIFQSRYLYMVYYFTYACV